MVVARNFDWTSMIYLFQWHQRLWLLRLPKIQIFSEVGIRVFIFHLLCWLVLNQEITLLRGFENLLLLFLQTLFKRFLLLRPDWVIVLNEVVFQYNSISWCNAIVWKYRKCCYSFKLNSIWLFDDWLFFDWIKKLRSLSCIFCTTPSYASRLLNFVDKCFANHNFFIGFYRNVWFLFTLFLIFYFCFIYEFFEILHLLSTWHYVFVILIKGRLGIWILVLHELHGKLVVFRYAVFRPNFTQRFSFRVVCCFVCTFLFIGGICLTCCIYIRFFTSSWRPFRCFCCFVSSCWLCSWQHLLMLLEYFTISQQLLTISVQFVWRLRTDT